MFRYFIGREHGAIGYVARNSRLTVTNNLLAYLRPETVRILLIRSVLSPNCGQAMVAAARQRRSPPGSYAASLQYILI
jgi:hypothetical protein